MADKGCDLTGVYHEKYGKFVCLWERKRFEKKLNDYMEDIDQKLINIVIDEQPNKDE